MYRRYLIAILQGWVSEACPPCSRELGQTVGTALRAFAHPTSRRLANHTAINCAALARFGFFTFAGSNREQAANPAVSATPGLRDTMAATIAPSINSAS